MGSFLGKNFITFIAFFVFNFLVGRITEVLLQICIWKSLDQPGELAYFFQGNITFRVVHAQNFQLILSHPELSLSCVRFSISPQNVVYSIKNVIY